MQNLMTDTPILVSALAFFSAFFFLLGILQFVNRRAKKNEYLEKIRQSAEAWESPAEESLSLEPDGKGTGGLLGLFRSLGNLLFPSKVTPSAQIRSKFLKAGLRRPSVPAVFWGAKFFFGVCFLLSFVSLRAFHLSLLKLSLTIPICLIIAMVGFYLPDLWLQLRIMRRKETLLRGLPDALDLLVVCVEAGMGLDEALNRVADEINLTNPLLSGEIKLTNLEIRAGKTRQEALRNLAIRTDLEEVTSLVTLLIQTDKFGTSVAQALRVYSDSFRTKRFDRAEEMAAKIPVKLVFPLVLFILPSLFVAILGPAVIRIYQTLLAS